MRREVNASEWPFYMQLMTEIPELCSRQLSSPDVDLKDRFNTYSVTSRPTMPPVPPAFRIWTNSEPK